MNSGFGLDQASTSVSDPAITGLIVLIIVAVVVVIAMIAYFAVIKPKMRKKAMQHGDGTE